MKSFLKIVAAIVVGIGIVILGLLTMCSVAYKAGKEIKNEKLLNIAISDLSDERSYSRAFYYVRGRITNNGDEPVNLVQVGVDFLNADGVVLETDSTFAVRLEALPPGASKSFEIMTKSNPVLDTYKSYSVYVMTQ